MLDLTGIEAIERTELRHLVSQSARSIENALMLRQPHSLMVRLNWPGRALGDETDGLVCLDADGWVTGANPTARQMASQLGAANRDRVHGSEVFAMPFEMLFDASRKSGQSMEVPLWSGLRLQAIAQRSGSAPTTAPVTGPVQLKDVEIAMIRRAVAGARGTVQLAALARGISRATVYRKLGRRPPAP